MSPSLHPQGLAWIQQHEKKWNDLVGTKTTQLQSLFKEHLDWFRQHKSTASIIGTRRALVDIDTANGTPLKRRRFDNHDQDQLPQEEQQFVSHPTDEADLLRQSNNEDAPEFISIEHKDLDIASPNKDDLTDHVAATNDSHPRPTGVPSPSIDVYTSNSIDENDTKETITQQPTVSRESLLQRFKEEEKRYGRYGLRNRSLDTATANANLSSPPSTAEDTELRRRKTIHPVPRAYNIINTELEDTENPSSANDNTLQSQPTHSLSFILSSLHEHSKTLPNKQSSTDHGQEEQIDDEVQLVTRSNRNNKSMISDGGSLIMGRDNDSQDGSRQNSFIVANESSFLSRMFSFGRATGSNLEHSILLDDNNNSILGKSDSPKRSTETPGPRTSRLVCASPLKDRQISSRKSTRESQAEPILSPYLPRQSNTPQRKSLAKSEPPSKQLSAYGDSSPQIPREQHVEKEQDKTAGEQTVSEVVVIPSWATQPELDQLLEKQTKMDADTIFGKIPPVQVSRFGKTGR